MFNIHTNTSESKDSQERTKRACKEIMNSVLAPIERLKDYLPDEKFIIACLLYEKIRIHVNSKREIFLNLNLFMESYIDICIDILIRLKRLHPDKVKIMQNMINHSRLTIEEMYKVEDSKIAEILNVESNSKLGDMTTDEIFSIELFNNDSKVIVSLNKVRNLRKLYDTVLFPILMYYKLSLGTREKMLLILESFNHENAFQEKGLAVVFTIIGIEPDTIMNDIINSVIDVEFGIIRKKPNGIYISLPYMFEGALIRKIIDDDNKLR